MNRKPGEKIVAAITAVCLGAAVLAVSPQAFAQRVAPAEPEKPKTGPGSDFQDCPQCPVMIWLKPGTFTMGSPSNEAKRSPDEGPIREVKIGEIAVGKFEITFAEWDACVADGGCAKPPASSPPPAAGRGGGGAAANPIPAEPGGDAGFGRGRQPAINISWVDADIYLIWLFNKTGKKYRLLNESEWEYAARAGSQSIYPWGNSVDGGRDYANFEGVGGKDTFDARPAPVGSFSPNAFGLYDMAGNVAEWVYDCWSKDLTYAPTDGTAVDFGGCKNRVVRGASWASPEELQRSANRDWVGDNYRSIRNGFRVAWSGGGGGTFDAADR